MLIEYQIKRFDVVKTYFYNLRHSNRTRLIVFGAAALFCIYHLFIRYIIHGGLDSYDFIVAILWGLGSILFLPVLSFFTAKTKMRTLSIDQDGFATKIGSQSGTISWTAVDSVVATEDRIFIICKNANFLSIPNSAFANEDLRKQFIELARGHVS